MMGGCMMGGPKGGSMGGPMMGMGGADPQWESLVARIKSYQKMSDEQKETWWSYCDEQLNGVRDPARHDSETLQYFIDYCGVPAVGAAGKGGAGKGRPGAAVQHLEPNKQSLVERIKAYQ